MGSGYKDLFRFGVTDLRFRVEGFGSTMRKMSFSLARGDQGETTAYLEEREGANGCPMLSPVKMCIQGLRTTTPETVSSSLNGTSRTLNLPSNRRFCSLCSCSPTLPCRIVPCAAVLELCELFFCLCSSIRKPWSRWLFQPQP